MPKFRPTHTYSAEFGPGSPDTQPGDYFVSLADAGRYGLLLGPYPTHAEALERVELGRRLTEDFDSFAHFYSFGTCRLVKDSGVTGTLNDWVAIPGDGSGEGDK